MYNTIHKSFLHKRFSIVSISRHPASRIIHGKEVVLDTYDQMRHHDLITAFVTRRIIKKNEVWSKVAVVNSNVEGIERDLSLQGINVKQKELQQIVGANSKSSLSEKILLKFNQPFLVPLLQSYLSKVLVNGKMPPVNEYKQYNSLLQRIISLYKIFFYGENLSQLELTLQNQYLTIKKEKHHKINTESFKCFWTTEDTRGLNKFANWQKRPFNQYEPDRPFFLPFNAQDKLQAQQTINDVMMLVFPFNLKWKLMTKYQYIPVSKAYCDNVAVEHVNRIVNYARSEEILKFLNIPSDFQIEMAVVDCHTWMLIDRYKKLGTPQYKYLASKIQSALKGFGANQVGHLAIKKPDRFAKIIKTNTDNHFKAFTYHFNMAGFSRNNHYKGIDALVWSNVFHQKVQRYSDVVYRFSQYLIRNYQKLQNQPLETLNTCMVQFDCSLLQPNYKNLIQQVNPRIPEQQFQKQFAQDKDMKSYYYNFLVKQDSDVIHLSKVYPITKNVQTPHKEQVQQSGWTKINKKDIIGNLKKAYGV